MAIIGKVERKHWKVRLLNLSIHLILILGAITMVYPLLIMISGSIKSSVDFDEFSIFPQYLYDNALLYKKHLVTKFNGNAAYIFNALREPSGSVVNIPVPENPSKAQFENYRNFLKEMRKSKPHYWRGMGMVYEQGVNPLLQRRYRHWLLQKFGEGPQGLAALNKAYNTDYEEWDAIRAPSENFHSRRADTNYSSPIMKDVLEFKNTQMSELHTLWFDLDSNFIAYLRRRYVSDLKALNAAYKTNFTTWAEVYLPTRMPANAAFAADWQKYIYDNINPAYLELDPAGASQWHQFLAKKYQGNLANLNKQYRIKAASFNKIAMPRLLPVSGQIHSDWLNFIREINPKYLRIHTLADEYRTYLKKTYKSLDKVNEAFARGDTKFEEVPLDSVVTLANLRRAADWQKFLKTLDVTKTGLVRYTMNPFRDYIEAKFKKNGKVDYKEISLAFGREITNKSEIPFSLKYPSSGNVNDKVRDLYESFIKDPANLQFRSIPEPELVKDQWYAFLKKEYKNDIKALNSAWGKTYSAWEKIAPPIGEYEWFTVLENRKLLIKEFLTRNYIMVIDTIITNGYAGRNTLIYCFLAVLAALMVNPLCAYGLSRFKMAPAYKILLFLMLPMAFPAMVLGIPQFLLIKNLGLLNTFAALILPGMANGYSIFLLKGFFDSLPKELFESAALDGASEWTVFWHIAMGLSTPILSVLALGTFTSAYGNFMMAFLLCQDKSMWTMMVYLYQLQQTASQAVGFAALIIAAIPTLLVFIFCQNIIIKGIVVPSEK
ncbi:MAG: carbohydrate ABC transporter permease [Lentisphaeria bacterium]|nr:carbohydrate ABC transporter permease [Lentisphaeria bacterium]